MIHQWSLIWQLKNSHSKSNIFHSGRSHPNQSFYISNITLTTTSLSSDLGISFDPNLKFKTHIYEVKRAKQRAALIHRSFLSRNIYNLVRAFKIYVRPLVEYAPQVWSPYQILLINQVEGIQRIFTKRLPGLANLSYTDRLSLLKLQSLEHRRLLFDLLMCFKIVRGYTGLSFDDFFSFSKVTSTRGHPLKLVIPLTKTNHSKFFFSSRVIPIWNSLPSKFVTATSPSHFKTHFLSRFWQLFNFPNFLFVIHLHNYNYLLSHILYSVNIFKVVQPSF